MSAEPSEIYDLFIIGGGVNGCGIARDATGRGLCVGLAEMNDLGSATSSASTKLFHGGLRYLEYFEFRLVREALVEREVLLRAMPHISWPMRFVLPFHKDMRFESETPMSRLLTTVMPWMRGRRPAWLIRLGLFLYDHLGGRKILPAAKTLNLVSDEAGNPLQSKFRKAYEYSDCWVDDSRLVVLNARDAANRGADIMSRTKVVRADRKDDQWEISLRSEHRDWTVRARMLVNASGPWVEDLIQNTMRQNTREAVRLVRGSHIVTRRLFDHDKCYFFQGTDGRIIFAIPYEEDFTLIGTTDSAHADASERPVCTDEERDYLLGFATQYFERPVTVDDVVWTYSGVRPLYDDGASSATAATRDYVLKLQDSGGAPVLNVFGGKITTYRKLAEAALDKLAPLLGNTHGHWTALASLPGGDFAVDGVEGLVASLRRDYPFLTDVWARRLVRNYGTQAAVMLDGATTMADLGEDFGHTITARELTWSARQEWAHSADDFLWRRTKLGLRVSKEEAARIDAFFRDLNLVSGPEVVVPEVSPVG